MRDARLLASALRSQVLVYTGGTRVAECRQLKAVRGVAREDYHCALVVRKQHHTTCLRMGEALSLQKQSTNVPLGKTGRPLRLQEKH